MEGRIRFFLAISFFDSIRLEHKKIRYWSKIKKLGLFLVKKLENQKKSILGPFTRFLLLAIKDYLSKNSENFPDY
jgi:hypothetical protein